MARNGIYFIGIALPAELSAAIAAVQKQLYRNEAMLRPLIPHITLISPPSLEDTLPEEFIPKVREAAKPYLPLNIELTKVGFFRSTTAYIEVESLGLHSLQQRLLELLPDDVREVQMYRAYKPHITLAQIHLPRALNTPVVKKEINDSLELPVRTEIDSVSCFRWIKPRDYSVEAI